MIHRCKGNTKIFGVLVTLNHSGIEMYTTRYSLFYLLIGLSEKDRS
jgi:hypothetical protein